MGDTLGSVYAHDYNQTEKGKKELEERRKEQEKWEKQRKAETARRLEANKENLDEIVWVRVPGAFGMMKEKMTLKEAIERGCNDSQIIRDDEGR